MKSLFSEPDSIEEVAESSTSALLGYRLHRLEVLNWGTFDEAVHVLSLDGQTTLLVGQNGAGKSTLVDALLTLLVRPGKTRNYNLAAGANKTERTEKSYILGAYDRCSQEEDNRGQVRNLRKAGTTYSVLLAYFRNQSNGQAFTLVQLLYLSDGGVERIYCFSNDDRSIARDCSDLKGTDKLSQEMKKRGFKVSGKYTEYFEWFRKATGVQEQAMDMFNQTVAVKDIQRLNDFIRKHMLEVRPWGEKVDDLFRHFKDLSDAHRELERVRQQRDLLEPIERHGKAYQKHAFDLTRVGRLLAASESFFSQKVIELFEPEIERRNADLEAVRIEQQRLKSLIVSVQDECRRIKNEIEQSGGERLRQIPLLIETHAAEANSKRSAYERFLFSLREAALSESVPDCAAFERVRARFPELRIELLASLTAADLQRKEAIESRVEPVRSLRDIEAELQVLMQRQGNLPPEYVEMRRRLCEELRLAERDLPFVAELISVKIAERSWESSIEMVLRSFALSLLVPQRHYHLVSRYIDQTRLRDMRGHGQKLAYLQIGERERSASGPRPDTRSLFSKLDFRDGWSPLLPWVKAEVQERHNFRCCETIEEFQQLNERAITRNRQLKHNSSRHEKDDRDRVSDPRHFVLGWDNREKKARLAEAITTLKHDVAQLDSRIDRLEIEANAIRTRLVAVETCQRFTSFAEIDFVSHEQEISKLRLEQKALEENNDALRMLKARLVETSQQVDTLEESRDQTLKRENGLESEIKTAKNLVENHRRMISREHQSGVFDKHSSSFSELDNIFDCEPLTFENLFDRKGAYERMQKAEIERLEEELMPLRGNVMKAMNRFLTSHPDEKADLECAEQYLPDFLKLLDRIRSEDLPKYEDRFKERLNEKVSQEIGVLRGNLYTERADIEDRIKLLNLSLRQVQYSTGTHMRLEAKPVRDREVSDFRQELDACVSGQFEGTLAADEARYKQIESLLTKLQEDKRWKDKVTDVRNWFDFAAIETEDTTGKERSYHDDSAGQSGGEKAKLAFTILIAAIAFQYDLDPLRPESNRFHFVVVDEMFSRVDDGNSTYALELFQRFGLQLLIVAPLDAKARVTEDYVGCYLHVSKDETTSRSQVLQMTAREFQSQANEQPLKARTQSPH